MLPSLASLSIRLHLVKLHLLVLNLFLFRIELSWLCVCVCFYILQTIKTLGSNAKNSEE